MSIAAINDQPRHLLRTVLNPNGCSAFRTVEASLPAVGPQDRREPIMTQITLTRSPGLMP